MATTASNVAIIAIGVSITTQTAKVIKPTRKARLAQANAAMARVNKAMWAKSNPASPRVNYRLDGADQGILL